MVANSRRVFGGTRPDVLVRGLLQWFVRRIQWTALALICLSVWNVGYCRAQLVNAALWSANSGSTITAVARSGNTIYIGGNFSGVGVTSGGGVPFNTTSGAPVEPFPRVAGWVIVAIADGEGGEYIGGRFTSVGGVRRKNLAHVLADGAVEDWGPEPDGDVYAIALDKGCVYIGGLFQHVGAQRRSYLARITVS